MYKIKIEIKLNNTYKVCLINTRAARHMSTDKNALPLYNINSDQSKFKQIIRLIGLVCICACICATVYYTTDRILTHIEKESKVHPAPNVSTIILQESEPVLVENMVPVEPTPTPAPAPAPTLDLSNIARIHPRDLGAIARMGWGGTRGGLYGTCCFGKTVCVSRIAAGVWASSRTGRCPNLRWKRRLFASVKTEYGSVGGGGAGLDILIPWTNSLNW